MMSWFSPRSRNVSSAVSLKTLAYLKIQSQVSDGSHASPFLPLWAIAFSVGLLTASTLSTNSSLPGTTDLKNINKANPQNAIVGRELIKEREKHMGADVSIFYREAGGLVITSGDGVYLQDIDGNRYLDCINNVAVVGHSHPTVVTAGQVELGKIQTNTRFLNPVQQRYVKKLLATLPPDLDTIYFVNSGSEANELALRLAKSHSTAARPDHVICIDSAYHGNTQTLIGISPYKWSQATDGKNYRPPTTHVVSLPDGYRGKYPAGQTPLAGELYAAEVEDLVSGPKGGVGVFIAEGIVGCGGQIVLPPGYLQKCYGEVRRRGGVCIADEVQTGFGRTGNKFWMFEEYGVVPDIVTLGKPMGNGYPLAAVVCRREIADSFAASGIEYFNTFAGNSVACAIGEAVLDTIFEEKLQANAQSVGAHLQAGLQALSEKCECIGEVRGLGLFLGIEFVRPTSDLTALPDPYPELAKFLVDYLMERRILVSQDGPDENVIKLKPPLVFSKEDADTLVRELESGLRCASKEKQLF